MSAMEQTIRAFEHMSIMENVSEDLPLNSADSAAKFKELVFSGKLGEELGKAYKYVSSLPAMVPAGITVATREFADVKRLVVANPLGVMFSGTLSQLVFPEQVLHAVHPAEIACVIQAADTDVKLQNLLGIIFVHLVHFFEGEPLRFMPVNKHAEVAALCLLMFWHSGDPMRHSRLWTLASDMVFLGCRWHVLHVKCTADLSWKFS